MKVLVIGGSRNIGYYSAQRLLGNGATVIFLLRNTSCFDTDESIKQYIASGKARLVQGDALKKEDVGKALAIASEGDEPLDAVHFSVGTFPKFSITKGLVLDPPNLCARSMLNLLSVLPRDPASQPKLVVVSSTGLGKTAHAALPLPLKPFYGLVLDGAKGPHADKLGMERVITYAAGWEWPAADGEPDKTILADGWQDHVGPYGWLKHAVVVRPALLTNGDSIGENPKKPGEAPYRALDHEMKGGYTISRKDVAHFIVTRVLPEWNQWEGKRVRIAY
ncbi:hypothetical protein ACEPAF_5276 [Sanghuangporus sanghuang]